MAFSRSEKRWKYVHRMDQGLQLRPRWTEIILTEKKCDVVIVLKVNNVMLVYGNKLLYEFLKL